MRIQIRIDIVWLNQDPDPGGQKLPRKKTKKYLKKIKSSEVLYVPFWQLDIFFL
jgi:hypothetical protein